MKHTYHIAGYTYPTQISLEAEVRARLAAHPLGRVFSDDFLAEVINLNADLHAAGQRSDGWFVRVDEEGADERGLSDLWGVQTHPHGVLLALLTPSNVWLDVPFAPWRRNRHRYSDVAAVLRGERGILSQVRFTVGAR